MAKRYLWVVERWGPRHGWRPSLFATPYRKLARDEARRLRKEVPQRSVRVRRYIGEDQ